MLINFIWPDTSLQKKWPHSAVPFSTVTLSSLNFEATLNFSRWSQIGLAAGPSCCCNSMNVTGHHRDSSDVCGSCKLVEVCLEGHQQGGQVRRLKCENEADTKEQQQPKAELETTKRTVFCEHGSRRICSVTWGDRSGSELIITLLCNVRGELNPDPSIQAHYSEASARYDQDLTTRRLCSIGSIVQSCQAFFKLALWILS